MPSSPLEMLHNMYRCPLSDHSFGYIHWEAETQKTLQIIPRDQQFLQIPNYFIKRIVKINPHFQDFIPYTVISTRCQQLLQYKNG